MAEEELWKILEKAFQAYGALLENLTAFKYLGRLMTAGDDDRPEVSGIMLKTRESWGWM